MCLIAALLAVPAARADVVGETLDDPAFGPLTVERTTDEPKGVVLFASGKGGWNADLNAVVREVAKLDYVVTGIDLDALSGPSRPVGGGLRRCVHRSRPS